MNLNDADYYAIMYGNVEFDRGYSLAAMEAKRSEMMRRPDYRRPNNRYLKIVPRKIKGLGVAR